MEDQYKEIEVEFDNHLYKAYVYIETKENPDYGPRYIQDVEIDEIDQYKIYGLDDKPLAKPEFLHALGKGEIPLLPYKLLSAIEKAAL